MECSRLNQQEYTTARAAWMALEPYHAMIYFAPEARTAYTAAGLKGFWMGYFASRAAPLGPVPASVVSATFFNFHPNMVARAIPDAWNFSSPQQVQQARLQAADATLHRLLDSQITSDTIAEAAELAQEAAIACPFAGRPLFAAYQQMPWPTEPHLILWHAATLLREFRGDGHVVALLAEGLDGCETHVTLVGTGNMSRETIQPHRGWSDEEWDAACQRLQQRGLLDKTGRLTPDGIVLRQTVEGRTDMLALAPWQSLGKEKSARLIALAQPISRRIVEQGGIPMPNPMGVPKM